MPKFMGYPNACVGSAIQVVSDMPPHRSLRGAEAVGGGRTFDDGCRGVGGNWAIPTCSVGDSCSRLRRAPAPVLLDRRPRHRLLLSILVIV